MGKDNVLEHVVVVDGDAPGRDDARRARRARRRRLRLRGRLARSRARRRLHAHLHVRHHRPAQGRPDNHNNMAETVRSYDEIILFPDAGKVVSYLPMAHVAERNVSHYLPMMLGYVHLLPKRARGERSTWPEVKPTWFFAVPRIWEKLEAGLEDARRPSRTSGRGRPSRAPSTFPCAGQGDPGGGGGARTEQQWQQADEQVLSNVRVLGLDEIEACNVGAAPTPPEVIEFFHALGVPLAELWGMSETTGAGTCNPPDKIKIGTVGPPAPASRSSSPRTARCSSRAVRDGGVPQPAGEDQGDVYRRRLPDDRRHRRVRRGSATSRSSTARRS